MYRDVWEWREKVKELPDEELIRIWAEEIDHNGVKCACQRCLG
jgi:hypothetical protein